MIDLVLDTTFEMPVGFLAGVVKQRGPSLMLLTNLTKMKYQTLFPKLKYMKSLE